MYSRSNIAVDRGVAMESPKTLESGLGFDFSAISDLVKSALPVGLNLYSQQLQLKQTKALAQAGYSGGFVQQSPGVYGQQYGILPMSQVLQPQPTFGGQYAQPSSGISTTVMLAIGGAAVLGLLAYKMMR
jgi:hypothetical protein